MPCASRWRRAARPSWQAGCRSARWRCRPRPPRGCWIKEATSARRAALELLEAVRGGVTFAAARDRHLAGLAERDRRLAHELAAGVLRRRAQLDLSLPLATTDPRLHDILRLGAYQLRALDRVPAYAAVSTSVALAREIAGEAAAAFVNQALRTLPRRLPGFVEGAFIVQDPAHALVCRYAAVPRGALLYDACAAPGGKGVTLERLGARVVAGDARHDRLARLADTVRRAGVAIPVVGADLVAAPLAPATVDAVLVDAPCSATGTMARHPDARWRLSPGLIGRAAARQRELFRAAAPLVRRGGLLVYATCSLEPEENGDVVNDFLQRHGEFAREPERGAVAAELLTADGDFHSLPQRHGVDGAFAARLRRSHCCASAAPFLPPPAGSGRGPLLGPTASPPGRPP